MLENAFVLGAAQLGMAYGVANRTGDLTQAQVDGVLDSAMRSEIRFIDTAASYGESESRIGHYLRAHRDSNFQIISKLIGSVDPLSAESVRASVEQSRQRLGCVPWAMLLHNPSHLEHWDSGLGDTLIALQTDGQIGRIGVSVYTPEEFRTALEIDAIACIQAPFGVFDQRLIVSGLLLRAVALGKTVFFRSVYLQGLLLMSEAEVAARFGVDSQFHVWSREWRTVVGKTGRSASEVALGFVRSVVPEGLLVLGCENSDQVEGNAALLQRLDADPLSKSDLKELSRFAAVPPAVYDPRLWPKPQGTT